MKKYIGYGFLSVPFIVLFIYYALLTNFWFALGLFSVAVIVVVSIAIGSILVFDKYNP